MEKILEVKRGDEGEIIFVLKPLKGFPEPAREHLHTATKELLLALRGLLDASIQYQEKKVGKRKPTKIEIQ